MNDILLGAVAYDPKVVTIWEGMRAYFRNAGVPLDYVLFGSYERRVEALFAGHIDIAWNTPLAARPRAATSRRARALPRDARQRPRLLQQDRRERGRELDRGSARQATRRRQP